MNTNKTTNPAPPASLPPAWTIILFALLCPSMAFAHDPAGWARSGHTGQIVALLVIIIAPLFLKIPRALRGIIIAISVGGAACFGLLPVLDPFSDLILEYLRGDVTFYGLFFVAGFLLPILFSLLVTGLVLLLRFAYKRKNQKEEKSPT